MVRQSLFLPFPLPALALGHRGGEGGGRRGRRGRFRHEFVTEEGGPPPPPPPLLPVFGPIFFLRCASSAPLSQKMQLQPLHHFPFRSAVGRTIMHCGVQYTLAGPSPRLACTIVQSACSHVTSLAESKLGKGRKKGQQKKLGSSLGCRAVQTHRQTRPFPLGHAPLSLPPHPVMQTRRRPRTDGRTNGWKAYLIHFLLPLQWRGNSDKDLSPPLLSTAHS